MLHTPKNISKRTNSPVFKSSGVFFFCFPDDRRLALVLHGVAGTRYSHITVPVNVLTVTTLFTRLVWGDAIVFVVRRIAIW